MSYSGRYLNNTIRKTNTDFNFHQHESVISSHPLSFETESALNDEVGKSIDTDLFSWTRK